MQNHRDQNHSNGIVDRLSSIQKKYYAWKSEQKVLVSKKAESILELSEVQSYLDSKDQVSEILNKLQIKTQMQTKGVYENLLTQLIHEIKGYDEENHKLILNSRIKSNKPWLDIEIENISGKKRDVYLDKGASIENIVSIGLKFITLSRIPNRKFLVFDEADKNLNPKQIPNLAKILLSLSQKVGVQVLYISHHNHQHFEGSAKIIELTRRKSKSGTTIVTDTISDLPSCATYDDDEEMDGVGIRYIRLQNFKQHENTIIEPSRLVTVITGDIDIGKSSIIHAFDAVNKNLGREGLIRDEQSFCRVEIGIEEGKTLNWSYKLTGSRKTEYVLTNENGIILEKHDLGTNEPEWLHNYLGMKQYKDFDINISGKNSTSFILDSKISGHKRAEILALGKESDQVMKMIKVHSTQTEQKIKSKNSLVREITKYKNKLEPFRLLFSIEELMEKIDSIKANESNRKWSPMDLRSDIVQLSKLDQSIRCLESSLSIARVGERESVNTANLWKDTNEIICTTEKISAIESITLSPVKMIRQERSCDILINAKKLKMTHEIISALEKRINNISIETKKSTNIEISELGKKMSILMQKINEINCELTDLSKEEDAIKINRLSIKKTLEEYCPLCERRSL